MSESREKVEKGERVGNYTYCIREVREVKCVETMRGVRRERGEMCGNHERGEEGER